MRLTVVAALVASTNIAQAESKHAPAGVFVTVLPVLDHVERTAHVESIRTRLGGSSLLHDKHVDVNVTRLTWVTVDNCVEVQVELAFVMSTTKNEIVSIARQTAKLVMPKGQFSIGKLPALRREVLDNALGDLLFKLRRAAVVRSV